jgi:hypothetical protein
MFLIFIFLIGCSSESNIEINDSGYLDVKNCLSSEDCLTLGDQCFEANCINNICNVNQLKENSICFSGNGVCNTNGDCIYCGDGICNNKENCKTCNIDCGECDETD